MTATNNLRTALAALKPKGWTVRKTGSNGQWMLEHAEGKRKLRFWPGSCKWLVVSTALTNGGLYVPAGMPKGTGVESLIKQAADWGLA